MVNIREIRTKIKSIQSTQKITRAMEMVAASKMKKAQERMFSSRPYSDKLKNVIKHVSKGTLEYKHRFTVVRPIKCVGFIVITSDRGLSGGLNANLLKTVTKSLIFYRDKGIEVKFFAVGKKAVSYLKRLNCNIVSSITGIGDMPHSKDIIGLVHSALKEFDRFGIDSLYIAYNKFINTMTQKPILENFLPITDVVKDDNVKKDVWDYIYEPDAQELLDKLLLRYVESLFFQGVVENAASEQAARMVAMKSASDNATDLIDEFKLVYNKARQSAITQELSEIVSGAAAV